MNLRHNAIEALETHLGYRFENRLLLDTALTHASVAEGARKIVDNERLEFLGDRVLGLMVAELLMTKLPEASEGELSRRVHSLVSRETCASVAKDLGLGAALRLAAGETKNGGRENPTILGDAMEALIAAVYLDGGYAKVLEHFKPLWLKRLHDAGHVFATNPKSFLQEWAAGAKHALPKYSMIKRKGPDHAPEFTIELVIEGFALVTAKGRSRQEAEKAAALIFIEREGLS